jgi:hypothetical protein
MIRLLMQLALLLLLTSRIGARLLRLQLEVCRQIVFPLGLSIRITLWLPIT